MLQLRISTISQYLIVLINMFGFSSIQAFNVNEDDKCLCLRNYGDWSSISSGQVLFLSMHHFLSASSVPSAFQFDWVELRVFVIMFFEDIKSISSIWPPNTNINSDFKYLPYSVVSLHHGHVTVLLLHTFHNLSMSKKDTFIVSTKDDNWSVKNDFPLREHKYFDGIISVD